ncbi:hypothetical protein HDU83_007105 [Entophlyctis luteolus]|nr:hypothetical protein HDU83_007105 [Entophlyctis luteolus]
MDSEILPFLLPPPPATWDAQHEIRVHKRVAPVAHAPVEPVGPEFLAVLRRDRLGRTLTQDWELETALKDAGAEEDDDWVDEPEPKADPSNWKKQDHYAIMGLARLRWTATDDDIKKAYRKKVLKHHPDKKAALTGKQNDDAYFKCLQKAYEILTDPVKRRQWDSCDPTFDDTLPPATLKKGQSFYDVYGPAFEKEARFAKDPAVRDISLGDDSASREHVEAFYAHWVNFDSWRTFEFMDEEEEGLGLDGSRDAKRYLDKKNRAARSKLKKEDNQRVIKFIENAMKLDPRVQRIKEEEKAAREAKKFARENAGKKEAEEAKRRAEEQAKAEEAAAALEKERREAEKKEREAHKKLARKTRNAIRAIFSENNYFLPKIAKPSEIEDQQAKLDSLLEASELWQLEEFKERLDAAISGGASALKEAFDAEVTLLKTRQESEASTAKASAGDSSTTAVKKAKAPWSTKQVNALVKAIKNFPGGTVSRWEKIAEYVNLHGIDETAEGSTDQQRSPDECIKKSKEMQDATVAERTALQAAASEAAQKKKAVITEKPSDRTEVNTDVKVPTSGAAKSAKGTASAQATVAAGTTAGGFVLPDNDTWSSVQQSQLEDALKKFPASQFAAAPAKRWEEIAKEIDGKNLKEVKQRMKDLADALKKKGGKK